MPAGELRHLVGFYQRQSPVIMSPPATDYGETEGDFPATATFTVPAKIKPRLGGEQVLADRLTGKNLVNITVRQSSATDTVTTDWMAKDERTSEIFNIRSIIDPTDEGAYWEMLCEKGVAV